MRTFLIIFVILFGSINSYSQTNPQYEFYSNFDISTLTGGVKNCVKEAQCIEYAFKLYDILKGDSISESNAFMASLYAAMIFHNNNGSLDSNSDLKSVLYKVALLNDRQRIDMLQRLYEIENTCYIKYRTRDDMKMNFETLDNEKSDSSLIRINCGTSLVSNSSDDGGLFTLKFAERVTEIDANLFNENITHIVLPNSKELIYLNNSRKSVANIKHIEGQDVKQNSLVNRDSVLIVAAVSELSEFSVPSCVKVLGMDCLRESKITKVYIPETVQYILSGAFENCSNLNEIYMEGDAVKNIDDKAFGEGENTLLRIYVPKALLKAYKKKYPMYKKNFATQKT